MKTSRLLIITGIAGSLLLLPLIAMQFSSDVVWTASDFLIAGILLLTLGLTIEWVLRKVPTLKKRMVIIGIILAAFFLVWAELAVGVFGTPFAGS